MEFDKGTTRFYCTKGDEEHRVWTVSRQIMQMEHQKRKAEMQQLSRSSTASGRSVQWPSIRCDWRERSPLSETRVEGEPGLGCVVSGRPAGRSAGRPGGARVVSGAEKKII